MDIDERFDSRKYCRCYPGFRWKGESHSPCLSAFRLCGTGVFFPRTTNSQANELEKLVEGSCRSLEDQLPLFLLRSWRIPKATHLKVSFRIEFIICKFCQFRKSVARCPMGIGSARGRHKTSPKKLLRKHRALLGFHQRQLLPKNLQFARQDWRPCQKCFSCFYSEGHSPRSEAGYRWECCFSGALHPSEVMLVGGVRTFRTGGIHIRPS
jgi:hypothetical protein